MRETKEAGRMLGELVCVAVFSEHPDPFNAWSCVCAWLADHGLEECNTQAMCPTAVIEKDSWSHGSSKWNNIARECFTLIPGCVVGGMRHGPLRVLLRPDVAAGLDLEVQP